MRKYKLSLLLLLTLGAVFIVPTPSSAAFDAPEIEPVVFGLANLSSFRDPLLNGTVKEEEWYVKTAVCRLFGMPELQPYNLRLEGAGLGGRWRFLSNGISLESYREISAGFGYGRNINSSLRADIDIYLLNLAIDDYGSTWSYQLNGRLHWIVQSGVELGFAWRNITQTTIGRGGYRLPSSAAIGGGYEITDDFRLFLELEKETIHTFTPRAGAAWRILEPVTILFGFQSNPDIISTGLSFSVSHYRAAASYQYHPDLGFSQCYGITVIF
ncbi:hypothetical protein CEE37_10885 [candidate division LCP-89 bacterium B3_LCP]|uniref:Outer membrane protein beta-barrel domain-containing protein n=1 Tax=candidate division LCP-89 bacterium B3_LCP TaxID=2012998 RepID=A0A532UXU8_UNCL8|nr:MAG: hypothetical protein CEE37_10885 [candidate division LCP-89 bacterium B3_LCP]